MNMKNIILGIVLLALSLSAGAAQSDNRTPDNVTEIGDDIGPYAGSIGPGSALYGLKVALEDFDEGFTFDDIRKLEKQEFHARQRIAEAKAELQRNKIQEADRALEQYREKIRESDDLVGRLAGNNTGLLQAQRSIIKHQLVLERLLATHPNVTGLETAFNNSIGLEERFELKTRTRLERIEIKDRQRIRIREVEREQTEIIARLADNATNVRVEVKFLSASTDRDKIAQEILEKFKLNRDNISSLLEIRVEQEDRQRRDLEARADVRRNISEVEAEFRFPLNTTERTQIIEGIFGELSGLTKEEILGVLELKVMEQREKRRIIERENLRIRAKIFDDASEARVELEFLTESAEQAAIAQEIRDRLNLSREEIDGLLETEVEAGERARERERQEIEVKIEKGATEVKLELRFPLNATSRDGIIEAIRQKLSTLNIGPLDIQEKGGGRHGDGGEDRRGNRQEDREGDRSGRDGGGRG